MTSTSPIFAEICNAHPYAAYSHGTIRTIPFEDNLQGKSVKHGYQSADVVMITNADYIKASKKLEFDEGKVVFIPHGFDETLFNNLLSQNLEMKPTGPTTFIAPARHIWVEKGTGHEKGNDKVIHAIRILKDSGNVDFNVLVVEHGQDLSATKELARKLDVEDCITWTPRLNYNDLWALISSSHAVIDQFVIPAIGAIGLEALALGRRLINHDDGSMEAFFDAPSPLISAYSAEEIAAAMKMVIKDPFDKAGLGASARDWFKASHSQAFIKQQLLLTFKLLDDAIVVKSGV